MSPKKIRSPLHGASRRTIAAMRELTRACLQWERTLGTPRQQFEPDVPIWVYEVLTHHEREGIRDRSNARWQKMPHFEESHAVWKDEHLRRYDRRAWETAKLREELAEIRCRVESLAAPAQTYPDDENLAEHIAQTQARASGRILRGGAPGHYT